MCRRRSFMILYLFGKRIIVEIESSLGKVEDVVYRLSKMWCCDPRRQTTCISSWSALKTSIPNLVRAVGLSKSDYSQKIWYCSCLKVMYVIELMHQGRVTLSAKAIIREMLFCICCMHSNRVHSLAIKDTQRTSDMLSVSHIKRQRCWRRTSRQKVFGA